MNHGTSESVRRPKSKSVYGPRRVAAGQCRRRSVLCREQSSSARPTDVGRVEYRLLTDEEQSLLDLRRVRLPKPCQECARHLLVKRYTYVRTRLV
jgi:hypothetical protein